MANSCGRKQDVLLRCSVSGLVYTEKLSCFPDTPVQSCLCIHTERHLQGSVSDNYGMIIGQAINAGWQEQALGHPPLNAIIPHLMLSTGGGRVN